MEKLENNAMKMLLENSVAWSSCISKMAEEKERETAKEAKEFQAYLRTVHKDLEVLVNTMRTAGIKDPEIRVLFNKPGTENSYTIHYANDVIRTYNCSGVPVLTYCFTGTAEIAEYRHSGPAFKKYLTPWDLVLGQITESVSDSILKNAMWKYDIQFGEVKPGKERYFVNGIKWSVDDPEDEESLPSSAVIDIDLSTLCIAEKDEMVVEALTDEYGFCIESVESVISWKV